MTQKLESKKFLIPTEYYAAPPTFAARTLLKIEDLESQFVKQSYRRRNYDQRLLPGDYFIATREECSARLQVPLTEEQAQCFGWVNKEVETNQIDSSIQVLVLQKDNLISQVFKGSPFQEVKRLYLLNTSAMNL